MLITIDEDEVDGRDGCNFDNVLVDCDSREVDGVLVDGVLMFVRPMCGTGALACKCIAPCICLVMNGVLVMLSCKLKRLVPL
jgi:hypothetical protein